jgi:hypothetical protein
MCQMQTDRVLLQCLPRRFIPLHKRNRQQPVFCARLHEQQRGLGRHAPKRYEQGQWRRNQHNHSLELRRVEHPG